MHVNPGKPARAIIYIFVLDWWIVCFFRIFLVGDDIAKYDLEDRMWKFIGNSLCESMWKN